MAKKDTSTGSKGSSNTDFLDQSQFKNFEEWMLNAMRSFIGQTDMKGSVGTYGPGNHGVCRTSARHVYGPGNHGVCRTSARHAYGPGNHGVCRTSIWSQMCWKCSLWGSPLAGQSNLEGSNFVVAVRRTVILICPSHLVQGPLDLERVVIKFMRMLP